MRFSVLPRLNTVTEWPRASAASTVFGPRKPVPPRIRIRFDGLVWIIRLSIIGSGPVWQPSDGIEATSRASSATPPATACPRKWRRVDGTVSSPARPRGGRPARATRTTLSRIRCALSRDARRVLSSAAQSLGKEGSTVRSMGGRPMVGSRCVSTMPTLAILAIFAMPQLARGGDAPREVAFKKQRLSDVFFCEGATFGDLNKDGHGDVISGPFWFEGPDFTKRHALAAAQPFDPLHYSDNFFAFVYDFDKDSWP